MAISQINLLNAKCIQISMHFLSWFEIKYKCTSNITKGAHFAMFSVVFRRGLPSEGAYLQVLPREPQNGHLDPSRLWQMKK